MKKYILTAVIACVGLMSFAQSTMRNLLPGSASELLSSDPLYNSFIKSRSELLPEKNITFGSIMQSLSQDGSIRYISVSFAGNDLVNYFIGVYNVKTSEALFYFEKLDLTETEANTSVYDENRNLLYKTRNTAEKHEYISVSGSAKFAAPTCYSGCMDRQQASFNETLSGWIYWNIGPQSSTVQLMAAVNCQGCCKKWWHNAGC